jgi:ATP-dependent exoDNAse (exonuclease V) beta subunit
MTHILDDLTLQQRAAATKAGPHLVIAGAGTGKTKTLTATVADRIITHGIRPDRIIAVTFWPRDPANLAYNRIAKWKDDLVAPRDAPAGAQIA